MTCASRMFGTISPRGVATAMPRFTASYSTISPAASSQCELTEGLRATETHSARAITPSRDAASPLPLSIATSSSVRLTSTVRNTVTCGAENALATIAAAVALRTPLIGVRRSPGADDAAGRCVGAATDFDVDGAARRDGCAGAPRPPAGAVETAPSTSSRVIRPSAPVPVMRVRSTPRLWASLRTGGVDTVCELAATVSPARRSSGAVSRRGLRVGFAPVSTAGP